VASLGRVRRRRRPSHLQAAADRKEQARRFPPRRPSRLRANEVEQTRIRALAELAQLADDRRCERELTALLQQTRQPEVVSIPFVGVDARYGCGLYLNRRTRRYYARLDIVSPKSRHARPLTARGEYVDVKTGVIYHSANAEPTQSSAPDVPAHESAPRASFGAGKKSLLIPLEMGRYHESQLRYAPVAFLPQHEIDARRPTPGVPVAAHLVRRLDARREGGVRYELHMAFRLPVPEVDTTIERPVLALNRGLRHFYAAVLTDHGVTSVQRTAFTLGEELRAIQIAQEQARRERQRRGALSGSGAQTAHSFRCRSHGYVRHN
jgi:hypothetical protein